MMVFDYPFYKIHRFLDEFTDSPSFASVIVLFWLFQFNVFSVLGIILNNLDQSSRETLSPYFSTANTILIASIVMMIHFLYYYIGNRNKKIIARYNNENRRKSILGALLVVLYVGGTIVYFFKYTVPIAGGILK